MNYDDFVRGGAQVLAKTGDGDFKMVSMPNDIGVDSTIKVLEEGRWSVAGQGKEYKDLIEGGGDLVNIKGMDWDEKSKLRNKAGELSGSDETGFMHRDKGEKFKNVLNRYKKLFGKASKALPMLQILDIFNMKDEYDQIMEGTHPMSEVFQEIGLGVGSEEPQVYADGGIMRLNDGGSTKKKRKTQKTSVPSKKEWYAEKSDPTQHKLVNENQRLIEKYAAKGKDFRKTDQFRQNQAYLDNVTINRGGNRGRIYQDDPTLNTGNKIGDAYRRSLLNPQGHPGRETQLGVQGILDIDPYKARLGLENDPNSFFRFNQQLMEKNPAAYEQARPWASGKAVRGLASLALPGPLKMLGTIAKDVATLGGRGLKALIPKGMKKDLGFEWNKLKSNFPRLTNEQNQLLNIQIEEGKGKDVDITEQIKEGFDADKNWQDEMVKESGLVSDEVDENVSDWSEYTQKFQEQPGFDEEYAETRDTQYMPHVPINQAGKEDYLRQLLGAEHSIIKPGNVDQMYDYARRKEGEGQVWDQESRQWQEKPTAGTFDLSAQEDIFDVGGNQEQLDEVREQIDWNTANQPLGTSYWEQPELTEDFIKENLITGTDLLTQNQGGYLKKFDDGGYANMSTFEKLKAINDSIAEG